MNKQERGVGVNRGIEMRKEDFAKAYYELRKVIGGVERGGKSVRLSLNEGGKTFRVISYRGFAGNSEEVIQEEVPLAPHECGGMPVLEPMKDGIRDSFRLRCNKCGTATLTLGSSVSISSWIKITTGVDVYGLNRDDDDPEANFD